MAASPRVDGDFDRPRKNSRQPLPPAPVPISLALTDESLWPLQGWFSPRGSAPGVAL